MASVDRFSSILYLLSFLEMKWYILFQSISAKGALRFYFNNQQFTSVLPGLLLFLTNWDSNSQLSGCSATVPQTATPHSNSNNIIIDYFRVLFVSVFTLIFDILTVIHALVIRVAILKLLCGPHLKHK